jgi:hypothetical protein
MPFMLFYHLNRFFQKLIHIAQVSVCARAVTLWYTTFLCFRIASHEQLSGIARPPLCVLLCFAANADIKARSLFLLQLAASSAGRYRPPGTQRRRVPYALFCQLYLVSLPLLLD